MHLAGKTSIQKSRINITLDLNTGLSLRIFYVFVQTPIQLGAFCKIDNIWTKIRSRLLLDVLCPLGKLTQIITVCATVYHHALVIARLATVPRCYETNGRNQQCVSLAQTLIEVRVTV